MRGDLKPELPISTTNLPADDSALCQSCGACCSYSKEWPRFSTEPDADLDRIPLALVDDYAGAHALRRRSLHGAPRGGRGRDRLLDLCGAARGVPDLPAGRRRLRDGAAALRPLADRSPAETGSWCRVRLSLTLPAGRPWKLRRTQLLRVQDRALFDAWQERRRRPGVAAAGAAARQRAARHAVSHSIGPVAVQPAGLAVRAAGGRHPVDVVCDGVRLPGRLARPLVPLRSLPVRGRHRRAVRRGLRSHRSPGGDPARGCGRSCAPRAERIEELADRNWELKEIEERATQLSRGPGRRHRAPRRRGPHHFRQRRVLRARRRAARGAGRQRVRPGRDRARRHRAQARRHPGARSEDRRPRRHALDRLARRGGAAAPGRCRRAAPRCRASAAT